MIWRHYDAGNSPPGRRTPAPGGRLRCVSFDSRVSSPGRLSPARLPHPDLLAHHDPLLLVRAQGQGEDRTRSGGKIVDDEGYSHNPMGGGVQG